MLKIIPPRTVLVFTAETTLRQAPSFAGIIAARLYATAAAGGVLPTGPINWVYTGADGKPDTVFILEICLPVDRIPDDIGEFQYKTLPSFTCIEVLHEGRWQELPHAYEKAMAIVSGEKKLPNGISREEYIHMDFGEGHNNVTLVQVGID